MNWIFAYVVVGYAVLIYEYDRARGRIRSYVLLKFAMIVALWPLAVLVRFAGAVQDWRAERRLGVGHSVTATGRMTVSGCFRQDKMIPVWLTEAMTGQRVDVHCRSFEKTISHPTRPEDHFFIMMVFVSLKDPRWNQGCVEYWVFSKIQDADSDLLKPDDRLMPTYPFPSAQEAKAWADDRCAQKGWKPSEFGPYAGGWGVL